MPHLARPQHRERNDGCEFRLGFDRWARGLGRDDVAKGTQELLMICDPSEILVPSKELHPYLSALPGSP